jgi:hypothetical protein
MARSVEVGGSGRRYTPEVRQILYQGVSVSMLAEMFGMKRSNVERKLSGCPSAGVTNQGTLTYRISDAAPYLMKIRLSDKQIRETLQKADPKDFPAMTNKMFWEGLAQRRKYEEQVGDMWHTSDVAAVAASAFNAIRMSVLLLPDDLADKAGLNEQQRKLAQDVVDTALESMQESLVDALQKPSRSGQESSAEDGEI